MLWIDTFSRCVSNLILPVKQMMSDEIIDMVVIDSMGFALGRCKYPEMWV